MKFLLRATIPNETGNDLSRSGPEGMQALMNKVMSDVRPETLYFCIESGQRTLYAFVEVAEASDFVRIAEPFWLSLGCDVDIIPAMTQEDFAKAGPHIAAAAAKY
jgi:hypothetical protein